MALLPLVLAGHARGTENEPKVITLSCDGVLTPTYGDNKAAVPQSVLKSSVIVSLDEQTVFSWATSFPSRMQVGRASISAEGRSSTTVSSSRSVAILIGQVVAWMQLW